MPRKARVLKGPTIQADMNYGSILVSKLINRVMWDGKKTIASRIVVQALENAAAELSAAPLEVLDTVLKNVCPEIEVRGVRVGGANYQVPMPVENPRKTRLGMTWIVDAARHIKGQPMDKKLTRILIESYNNAGPAVEKKLSVHRTAAGNRALAHLASRVQGGKRKKKDMMFA